MEQRTLRGAALGSGGGASHGGRLALGGGRRAGARAGGGRASRDSRARLSGAAGASSSVLPDNAVVVKLALVVDDMEVVGAGGEAGEGDIVGTASIVGSKDLDVLLGLLIGAGLDADGAAVITALKLESKVLTLLNGEVRVENGGLVGLGKSADSESNEGENGGLHFEKRFNESREDCF